MASSRPGIDCSFFIFCMDGLVQCVCEFSQMVSVSKINPLYTGNS